MIEQTKFTYLLLGKALEKQTKAIENPGKNQIKAFAKHEKQLIMSRVKKSLFDEKHKFLMSLLLREDLK